MCAMNITRKGCFHFGSYVLCRGAFSSTTWPGGWSTHAQWIIVGNNFTPFLWVVMEDISCEVIHILQSNRVSKSFSMNTLLISMWIEAKPLQSKLEDFSRSSQGLCFLACCTSLHSSRARRTHRNSCCTSWPLCGKERQRCIMCHCPSAAGCIRWCSMYTSLFSIGRGRDSDFQDRSRFWKTVTDS